ncbi:family 2B encapsulin nanocompartment shell protein [Massilia sp. TS11]|uniref:family 2B encapsulin nanocompartment shell protein n=1 Tax=Massilia sp. TS11 TaxID=2908003 RepID=UPI0022AB0B0D|nr:family 2B encapsulin nanocompartment shell protein [Massilia sp. TS11]
MAEDLESQQSLSVKQARNLANTTKSVPQTASVTPRWFMQMLPWMNLEGGTFRVNRRKTVVRSGNKIPIIVQNGVASLSGPQLKGITLFSDCEDAQLEVLAAKFKSENVAMGQPVLNKGDPADKFYILAEGKVTVWDTGEQGAKVRLAMLSDGDYIGEIGLLRGIDRTAHVEAMTPCVFLALSRADFLDAMETTPGLRERIEAGVARREEMNRATNEHGEMAVRVTTSADGEEAIQGVHIDYEEVPREYPLSSMQSIVRIHTRIADLYNTPYNQVQQQLRLTVADMKERQEWEMINNPDFGLLANVAPSMRIPTRYGPPTPDDLDELLALVWKEPAFFLAHPKAIAAFGRECTRRGVPPPTVTMFGSNFLTWRGYPLLPCDKLLVDGKSKPFRSSGKTNILLVRVGADKQGVVGLHKTGLAGEQMPGLSVRLMGINDKAIAEYLVTLYFSLAVMTEDAVGCLENVEVGNYYDYR